MAELDIKRTQRQSAPPRRTPDRRPIVVVKPARGWAALNLRELWEYPDLLWILAGRDVKLRCKQTALGVIWVILQPLVAGLIFAVISGRFAKLPSNMRPHFLFASCGLPPWNLFAVVLQRAGNSIVGDARRISKVYFPRPLVPVASTGAVLIDFAVALTVMVVLTAIYRVVPRWKACSCRSSYFPPC
jgi:lipopolysaccharide transport system permease protein